MEQTNHKKEIKAAIDDRDEEAFREIFLINNMITERFSSLRENLQFQQSDFIYFDVQKREETMIYAAKKGWKWAIVELVKVRTSLEYQDEDGWTAFYWAAWQTHFDCAKFLIEKGANINHKDKDKLTALHLAAHYGHYKCLKFLIENGAKLKTSALIAAARSGHCECMRLLIKNGADNGSVLYNAIENGHFDCVKLLVKSGADIEFSRPRGETVFLAAVKNEYIDILRFLIERGVDLSSVDDLNLASLHTAAQNGHCECVELLVKHDIGIDSQKKFNWIPLYSAAYNGHFFCAQILVEYGINHRNSIIWGKKAAQFTHENEIKSYLQYLDENESEWMFLCRTKNYTEAEKMLREDKSIDINEIGISGNTALHFIARANNIELYNLLVSRGADQNIENDV